MLVWNRDYAIPGIEAVDLHQVYRAMAWLGEALPADQQQGATPFAPRCTKDAIEEALFERRRDLFSQPASRQRLRPGFQRGSIQLERTV